MSRNSFFTDGVCKPTLLGESNSVFPGDNATFLDDPPEQFVQSVVRFCLNFWILVVLHHQIGVNVAITRMPKACDCDSGALLHFAGKFHEIQ